MNFFRKPLFFLAISTCLLSQHTLASVISDFNFDSGTDGDTIVEFSKISAPLKSGYSSESLGPTGKGLVMRTSNEIGNKSFGGRIADMDLGQGDEIWVRWYQYFPDDFKFANGINGDSNGGAGRIKWMRFQYEGNSERITFEIDAKSGCAQPCTNAMTEMVPESIGGENQGWRERYGNQMIFLPQTSDTKYPTGQWHAVQMYMRLSTGSEDIGDGDGKIRMWVNDQLIGEYDHNTMPISGTSRLQSVWLGNYWNGGFPADQHFYIDDVVVSSTPPAALDPNGYRYIAPGDIQLAVPPMPPGVLHVDVK